jgi:hypothetical protein
MKNEEHMCAGDTKTTIAIPNSVFDKMLNKMLNKEMPNVSLPIYMAVRHAIYLSPTNDCRLTNVDFKNILGISNATTSRGLKSLKNANIISIVIDKVSNNGCATTKRIIKLI